MKYYITISLLLSSIVMNSQTLQPENLGFREVSIQDDQLGLINFFVSTKNSFDMNDVSLNFILPGFRTLLTLNNAIITLFFPNAYTMKVYENNSTNPTFVKHIVCI